MIYHPAIIALLLGSGLLCAMLLYSCHYGVKVLRRWDLRSGSEIQLGLERRTYLISTIMTYAFGFQLVSLFLFIYTADHLASLFVGAMCAAGSLNANTWGYPTIILKIANFLLAGLWLALNFTDNRGYDYPLIRVKYALLLVMTPFLLAESLIQGMYFLGLEPNIITSCCGSLFSSGAEGTTSGIVVLPRTPVETVFYASMVSTFVLGIAFHRGVKVGRLFAASSMVTFLACILGLISFISLYFYELPTHHCPFCLLHSEYGYVGYALYLSFLFGAVGGLGVWATTLFAGIESLRGVLVGIQRGLTLTSLISYAVFLAISVCGILASNLSMRG